MRRRRSRLLRSRVRHRAKRLNFDPPPIHELLCPLPRHKDALIALNLGFVRKRRKPESPSSPRKPKDHNFVMDLMNECVYHIFHRVNERLELLASLSANERSEGCRENAKEENSLAALSTSPLPRNNSFSSSPPVSAL